MNISHKSNANKLKEIVELRSQEISYKEIGLKYKKTSMEIRYAYIKYCTKNNIPMIDKIKSFDNPAREAVRRRDNWTCQGCGFKWVKVTKRLHVHHLEEKMFGKSDKIGIHKYDWKNMDKLITFCASCHRKWHANFNRNLKSKNTENSKN